MDSNSQYHPESVNKGKENLGLSADMNNPNIISFELALEKVQNKLSLPEYRSSQTFGEGDNMEIIESIGSKELNNQNMGHTISNLVKPYKAMCYNTLTTMWRSQHNRMSFLNTTPCVEVIRVKERGKDLSNIELQDPLILPKWEKELTITKFASNSLLTSPTMSQPRNNNGNEQRSNKILPLKPISSMKQSTLSRFFSSNKEEDKHMCSSSIICDSTSTKNKKFVKLLHHEELIDPPCSESSIRFSPTLNIILTKSTNSVECCNISTCKYKMNVTSSSLSLGDIFFKSTMDSNSRSLGYDSLDLHIDNALEKYEGQLSDRKDKEVQVDLKQATVIHPCQCLRYHICENFQNMPDQNCIKRRGILALDLELYSNCSRGKKHTFLRSSFPQNSMFRKSTKRCENLILDCENTIEDQYNPCATIYWKERDFCSDAKCHVEEIILPSYGPAKTETTFFNNEKLEKIAAVPGNDPRKATVDNSVANNQSLVKQVPKLCNDSKSLLIEGNNTAADSLFDLEWRSKLRHNTKVGSSIYDYQECCVSKVAAQKEEPRKLYIYNSHQEHEDDLDTACLQAKPTNIDQCVPDAGSNGEVSVNAEFSDPVQSNGVFQWKHESTSNPQKPECFLTLNTHFGKRRFGLSRKERLTSLHNKRLRK